MPPAIPLVAMAVAMAASAAMTGYQASKGTPKGPAAPIAPGDVAQKEDETMDQAKMQERRKRQLIARQNAMIKTSPLGAKIDENKLGGTGTGLVGQ